MHVEKYMHRTYLLYGFNWRPTVMNDYEKRVFLDTCIDIALPKPLSILFEIIKRKKLSYQDFSFLDSSTECFQSDPLAIIPKICDLSTLLEVLEKFEDRQFSDSLKHRLTQKSSVCLVKRNQTGVAREATDYYNSLLRMFLDGKHTDPNGLLDNAYDKMRDKIAHGINERSRRKTADICIGLLCAVFDANMLIFGRNDQHMRHLGMMNKIITHSSDENFAESAYFTRMALFQDMVYHKSRTSSTHEGMEDGDMIMRKAIETTSSFTPCLPLATVFCIFTHHKLWKFEENPTRQTKNELISIGDFGIECLKNDNTWVEALWWRLIMTRRIFCLLGISNTIDIMTECETTEQDAIFASNLLNYFDNHRGSSPVEKRLEIYYYVARARENELRGFDATASWFAETAKRLAEMNNFLYMDKIVVFSQELNNRLKANKTRYSGNCDMYFVQNKSPAYAEFSDRNECLEGNTYLPEMESNFAVTQDAYYQHTENHYTEMYEKSDITEAKQVCQKTDFDRKLADSAVQQHAIPFNNFCDTEVVNNNGNYSDPILQTIDAGCSDLTAKLTHTSGIQEDFSDTSVKVLNDNFFDSEGNFSTTHMKGEQSLDSDGNFNETAVKFGVHLITEDSINETSVKEVVSVEKEMSSTETRGIYSSAMAKFGGAIDIHGNFICSLDNLGDPHEQEVMFNGIKRKFGDSFESNEMYRDMVVNYSNGWEISLDNSDTFLSSFDGSDYSETNTLYST